MRIVTTVVREECFTWTPEVGEGFTIAVTSLLAMVKPYPPRTMHFPDESLETIIAAHGVELPRLETMNILEATQPVLVIEHGKGHLLADGAHRRAYFVKHGMGNSMLGWMIPEVIWREFIVDKDDPAYMMRDSSLLPQRQKK